MWRALPAMIVALLALASGGCSCDPPAAAGDAATGDAAIDAAVPLDAGPADAGADAALDASEGGAPDASAGGAVPSTFSTVGGGVAASPRYRGRFSIGAPQPTGEVEGPTKRLTLGPGAAR